MDGRLATPTRAHALLACLVLPSAVAGTFAASPPRAASAAVRRAHANAAAEDSWRGFRARLVAGEQNKTTSEGNGGSEDAALRESPSYAFESGLIEQGAVLLNVPGRASRQPFFHKSVMLLVEHDSGEGTCGLILNRPSALVLDGWRLWFGGPVGDGNLFGTDPGVLHEKHDRQLVCLHRLGRRGAAWRGVEEGKAAEHVSVAIIDGVWYTTTKRAQLLVDRGVADKADFRLMVGYAGWAGGQLEAEVAVEAEAEEAGAGRGYSGGSWVLASADTRTLLADAWEEADAAEPDLETLDGRRTWEALMRALGREDVVERCSSDSPSLSPFERRDARAADEQLADCVREHLLPPSAGV